MIYAHTSIIIIYHVLFILRHSGGINELLILVYHDRTNIPECLPRNRWLFTMYRRLKHIQILKFLKGIPRLRVSFIYIVFYYHLRLGKTLFVISLYKLLLFLQLIVYIWVWVEDLGRVSGWGWVGFAGGWGKGLGLGLGLTLNFQPNTPLYNLTVLLQPWFQIRGLGITWLP